MNLNIFFCPLMKYQHLLKLRLSWRNNNFLKNFGCWPYFQPKIPWINPGSLDEFLFSSFLILMFPSFSSKVASLFCHIPSTYLRASSAPSFTQSTSCMDRLSSPHLAKCLPSSDLSSLISCLWPPCLMFIGSVLDPVYCLEQLLHVIKYTQYLLLHVRWWRILYDRPVKVLEKCVDSLSVIHSLHLLPPPLGPCWCL